MAIYLVKFGNTLKKHVLANYLDGLIMFCSHRRTNLSVTFSFFYIFVVVAGSVSFYPVQYLLSFRSNLSAV